MEKILKNKRKIGAIIIVIGIVGTLISVASPAINQILRGGKVAVTEVAGTIEYTSNPFSTWTTTLSIQSGAEWRARVRGLSMAYNGGINLTWALYNVGADGLIGTGDDTLVAGTTFIQTITVVSGVPQNVTASSDGFNPYNWGQWPAVNDLYVQTTVTEA